MTQPTKDWMAEVLALQATERADAEARVAKRSRCLRAALAAHGITSMDVLWDGGGDSGQIEDATFGDANGFVDASRLAATDCDGTETTLEMLARNLVHDLIEVHCPGLENGDGGDVSLNFDGTVLNFTLNARETVLETIAEGQLPDNEEAGV